MRLGLAVLVGLGMLLPLEGRAENQPDQSITAVVHEPMVDCPAGMEALMSKKARDAKLAPYTSDPSKMDPPPSGRKPPVLPAISMDRLAKKDPTFPRAGSARALLLEREDGRVAEVIVPCASSEKYVEPVVEALSKAKLNIATSDGKAVKHIVFVPIEINLDSP